MTNLHYLVPQKTVVSGKGEGAPLDISPFASRVLLVTLHITAIVEQQSLDVSIWGSSDGISFGDKSLAAFPQKFYVGKHPLLVDLSARPEIKMLRAQWNTNRWGRGTGVPQFEFYLTLQEVPREILRETATASQSLR